MLTPGNRKLGRRLIWGFGLPSGTAEVCVGMSSVCHRHCYARHIELLRPEVRARYEKNLRLSCLPDFAQRLRYFILGHEIGIVRIHTGGDFYCATYAQTWLKVVQQLPSVRFFTYSRSWRHEAIRRVLEQMAALDNCRVWYSADQETGLPPSPPSTVRVAWLMTSKDDFPPPGTDLVFRTRPLRRKPLTRIRRVRVCPAEDGVARRAPVTCELCRLCWRPLSPNSSVRIPLPVVPPRNDHESS